jgi:hypothetical protein
MKRRTSFALDKATLDLLKRLAWRWGVSQAEVVRRAIKSAAEREDASGNSIQEKLNAYRRSNRLDSGVAETFLKQVAEDRKHWRDSR